MMNLNTEMGIKTTNNTHKRVTKTHTMQLNDSYQVYNLLMN